MAQSITSFETQLGRPSPSLRAFAAWVNEFHGGHHLLGSVPIAPSSDAVRVRDPYAVAHDAATRADLSSATPSPYGDVEDFEGGYTFVLGIAESDRTHQLTYTLTSDALKKWEAEHEGFVSKQPIVQWTNAKSDNLGVWENWVKGKNSSFEPPPAPAGLNDAENKLWGEWTAKSEAIRDGHDPEKYKKFLTTLKRGLTVRDRSANRRAAQAKVRDGGHNGEEDE